ncbi:hypothetical protein GTNG_0312 [Geobacillus thermodenitrificans NG80-2]|uniref:Uncharacterized protein n=1 Tax=Geobacillus thermodenitrificans (strain NG80-2) TaxID=420246 RepID=A4IK40_GEOTN|nr:hypothetical protein GTNG_0312 [Geobacillus thermodenitrificans NG80-2]
MFRPSTVDTKRFVRVSWGWVRCFAGLCPNYFLRLSSYEDLVPLMRLNSCNIYYPIYINLQKGVVYNKEKKKGKELFCFRSHLCNNCCILHVLSYYFISFPAFLCSHASYFVDN